MVLRSDGGDYYKKKYVKCLQIIKHLSNLVIKLTKKYFVVQTFWALLCYISRIAVFILRRTNRLRRLVCLRRLARQYKQQVAIRSRCFLVKIKSSV